MDVVAWLAEEIARAVAGIEVAGPFLASWPEMDERRAQRSNVLPVCGWLRGMQGPLAALLAAHAAEMSWRQTYGPEDFGTEFLERYGWTEIIGLRGPIPSDQVAAGFLMLGPESSYPLHSHEAVELYLPLSGTAHWQKGDAAFAAIAPGTPILHESWEPHAIRTEAEPLLAVYLWRGGDLAAKSRILTQGLPIRS